MNYAAGWALGASVTIMALGLSIIAPALPLFGRTFGVGAALVGSLVSVYAILPGLSRTGSAARSPSCPASG